MSTIENIVTNLLAKIDRIVEQKLGEKLPALIRAADFSRANEVAKLVGALEVARLLGRHVATPESVRSAKHHVYDLASRQLILR